MKKRLCVLSEFDVFDELWDDPYVLWSEIKDVLSYEDYRKLIKYLALLHVHLRREWLSIKYLKPFLASL